MHKVSVYILLEYDVETPVFYGLLVCTYVAGVVSRLGCLAGTLATEKDWPKADELRAQLNERGIQVQARKGESTWSRS